MPELPFILPFPCCSAERSKKLGERGANQMQIIMDKCGLAAEFAPLLFNAPFLSFNLSCSSCGKASAAASCKGGKVERVELYSC